MRKLKEVMDVMKDKASQGKAVILSNQTNLSLLRATTHDYSTPPSHKHLSALLSSGDGPRATASATVELLMDRLQTTQSSAVALKCLIAVHHIIRHGTFILRDQLSVYPYTGGRNHLNLSNFRDRTNTVSWELSSWVRWFAQHIEHLLCASRTLGSFLLDDSKSGRPECVSGLANGELFREIEALLALVEGIGKRPISTASSTQGNNNRLVVEILGLVEEDGVAALSEVLVRVKEFGLRERLGSVGFGEGVELVCVVKRLEECRERMMVRMMEVAEEWRFWDSVRELKEKVGRVEVYREEEEEGKVCRTVKKQGAIAITESDRFAAGRVLDSVDFIGFPSSRFL